MTSDDTEKHARTELCSNTTFLLCFHILRYGERENLRETMARAKIERAAKAAQTLLCARVSRQYTW
jgi:hypothetical protein